MCSCAVHDVHAALQGSASFSMLNTPPAHRAPVQVQLQQAIEEAGFACSRLPPGNAGLGSSAGMTRTGSACGGSARTA